MPRQLSACPALEPAIHQEQNEAVQATTPVVERPCLQAKSGPELRASPRKRVFKGGVISYDDGHFTIACTLRNISETGARIQILDRLVVPDTFVLLIELDSFETDCEVVWRHEEEIGVRFLSPLRPVKKSRVQVVSESSLPQNNSLRRHPVR